MLESTYHPLYVAQQHRLRFNGLKIEMWHWPRNSRPKLLLLHGWMDCAASFQQLVDALPPCYDIYALSWRGHGASDWQTGSGHYERMAMLQDLHQCMAHISPDDPIDLIGHSMGSMLATHYAGLFPHRVRSLTMAEGFGMPPMSDDAWRVHQQRHIENPTAKIPKPLPNVAYVAQKLQKRNPNMQSDFANFMADALTHKRQQQLHYRADPKHDLPQAHPYDWQRVRTLWPQLTMPVLWLQGQLLPHNHYLQRMQSVLQERQDLLPNLQQVLTLQGSGHMLQWEAPQAFALALDNFLRQ